MFSAELKKEFTKQGLKERIDPKTTHPFWAKVRNVSAVISGGSAMVYEFMPTGKLKVAVFALGIITGFIGGVSWLDKSKDSGDKYKIVKKLLNFKK